MRTNMHDLVGVGFGPANIALAIAIEELHPGIDAVFLERAAETAWQPNMLFGTSDIQNHPLRDLVTPRNPRSHYTFVNFLFETGRLFEHLNLGRVFPIRAEYNQYIMWAASHFGRYVQYGHDVQRVEPVTEGKDAPYYAVHSADGTVTLGRSLVLAPGRTPYVPKPFEGLDRARVVHLVEFLSAISRLTAQRPGPCRIAVVGGSQSAVEIILHLAQTMPQAKVTGFLRGFGYRMKDASPFTGEVYFPDFVDLFYGASKSEKRRLTEDLRLTNYSAADADVLDALYLELYRQKILGQQRIDIRRSTDIAAATVAGDETELVFEQVGVEGRQSARFDLVILATGFRNIGTAEEQERMPPLFEPLAPWAELDKDGCIDIGHDYGVKMKPEFRAAPCYLNGLCESSHGMGDAGSFSLLSLRSETIIGSLAGRTGLVEAVANIA